MSQSPPIITLRGLKKSYDGVDYVLKGIDLDVAPGKVIGYIGPNGAGKTTTVKIMIGMLPQFSGEVKVLGLNIAQHAQDVKKRIGYVPETAALYETLTPNEYLYFLGQVYEIPKLEIQRRSTEMLSLFGLKEQANSRMNSFSKGMKQKVLIIASMIHNPDVLFMDEPLSGLDANMMLIVKDIMAQIAAKGKTIFYCSHVMDVVERMCDRIVIIDKGTIIADGTFDELQAMSKGESLERIFTQLTGARGQERIAQEFISAFEEKKKRMTNLILRVLDGFQWLFRLLKVDYPKFRALLWVKLTIDNREEKSVAQRRSDRQVTHSMIWVMVFYVFIGIVFGLVKSQ